jgi:hypothetical protein
MVITVIIQYDKVSNKLFHFQKQQENDSSVLAGDIRLEEELSKNTAEYNKTLSEQPSNVELWLRYVHFQVFYSFKCYFSIVVDCIHL